MLHKNVDSFISDPATSFFSSTSKEEALVLYKKNAALLINWLGKIAFEKAYKQKNSLWNSDNTQNESI